MKRIYLIISLIVGLLAAPSALSAAVLVQCPGDLDGDAMWESAGEVQPAGVKCMHLAAGDGFAKMADGTVLYTFSFSDVTGVMPDMVMDAGMLAANWPAPTIVLDQGDEFYLTITNVGMMMRPDLFDPHSVHWHGFPQAAPIFDGMPDSTITINMGASQSYYYNVVNPGTFLYHCHVEATEHMEMGMIGNLYVHPAQDGTAVGGCASQKYAYNDGDGSTCYDVDYPMQVGSFDSEFHILHLAVQPLPFAMLADDYAMFNGRGYPDTLNPDPLTAPAENGDKIVQKVSSLVTASAGQRILLRMSNVSVSSFYTIGTLGIPMTVVGKDAKLLRGPTGLDLYYLTNSVTLGGGESTDVILDTAGIAPGTYFLYATNLNYLSNNKEDFGGLMTEIVITP